MQRNSQDLDKILNDALNELDRELQKKQQVDHKPRPKSLLDGAFTRGVRIGPPSPKPVSSERNTSEEKINYHPVRRRPNRCHDFFKPVAQFGGFVAGLYLDFLARPHNPYYSNVICALLWGFVGGKTVDVLSDQCRDRHRPGA